jgi:hypothetical protein
LPHRIDLLSQRADAHVVVVHLLADDAQVVGKILGAKFLLGEGAAVGLGLLIDARVHRLERFVQ